MIDPTLISTALLALHNLGKLSFYTKSAQNKKTGFLAKTVNRENHSNLYFSILIYMDETSPTGYSIQVQGIDTDPNFAILDEPITSFKDFETRLMAWGIETDL